MFKNLLLNGEMHAVEEMADFLPRALYSQVLGLNSWLMLIE